MHRFFRVVTGILGVTVIGAMTLIGPAQQARAQQAAGQTQKKVKDQGEYDLFNSVAKETDPNKKIALLDTWKQKYPDSDYKVERQQYYLQAYQQLGKLDKLVEAGKELLALDPKNIQGLFVVAQFTPLMGSNSADALDSAEKAANGLMSAEKPAAIKDEDWTKAKKDFEALSHRTLGWVAMVRKNNEQAQQEFTKSLEINPNDGNVSYWLGTVILAQKKPELQSAALFQFARAAAYDGPGALNPQGRQQVETYLAKAYNTFHGQDPAGLEQLKQLAKANALPPADFKIKSAQEIAVEKEEQFRQSNPALALWMGLKKELTGPEGAKYFESSMKGANVPGGAGGVQKLKGKLVAAKPPVRSKELLVALADPNVPEVTLKLDAPLTGKPETGGDIEFEGIPAAFTPDPFMVTFDVEKDKIVGLKVEKAAPPPARRTGAKKGSASRKK